MPRAAAASATVRGTARLAARRRWLVRGAALALPAAFEGPTASVAPVLAPRLAASLVCVASPLARAESAPADWPERPVRLVVPFAAGSTPDMLARLIGQSLSASLKQPFIVENRPGAGGNLGTQFVARAVPDGYTLGVSITGPLVNNVLIYPSLGYDPFRDLAPITLAAIQPNVLVVPAALHIDDAAALFEALRRNPGRYNFASVGAGTLSHLSIELLKSHLGVEIVHVPYNGSPSAVASLLAGDTQIACLAPGAVMSQIQAGRLRALAVTTERRWPGLAQVPSFAELGMPQLAASAWIGIVAPAGTPASLIGRIHAQWAAALGDPPTAQKLRALGMEPVGNSPQAFAAFMREELKRWTPVIRAAAIAPP